MLDILVFSDKHDETVGYVNFFTVVILVGRKRTHTRELKQ